ncbi:MAG: DNA translocase FtsK [Candidatus Gracilibacteria bacterium]|nr:DNA translocase FtsK [Candidatus Gracilibacteria bacterium]MDD2908219.1 DNA translocase FtsK [Candidatus Gracilibacteria bacterium]
MAKNKKKSNTRPRFSQEFRNIFAGVALVFLGVLTFFGTADSVIGSVLGSMLSSMFGEYYRVIFAPVLIILGVLISIHKLQWNNTRLVGLLLFWLSSDSFIGFFSGVGTGFFDFSGDFEKFIGRTPSLFFVIGMILLSVYLLFRISYIEFLKKVGGGINTIKGNVMDIKSDIAKDLKVKGKDEKSSKSKNGYKSEIDDLNDKINELTKKQKGEIKVIPEKIEKKNFEEIKKVEIKKESVLDFFKSKKEEPKEVKKISQMAMKFTTWDFPSIDLLHKNLKKYEVDTNLVEKQSLEIKKTLLQFKLDVDMKGYTVGPTVIQYRLKPAEGVKLNKIENLKKDLTLALKAKSIRIEAPIPGLGLVGIEVPNEKRETVVIRDIIASKEFENHKSNLALVVGRNINGENIVADLAKMPHLLIAGQTGSGKSVAMNGFIVSLLYKNSPDMLRLIMIDPKRVELSIYNGIPHLLAPIISDHEKALNSLKWCVAEMMRRYDIMTQLRARNLEEYNKKVVKKEKLPNIVVVVDELAELMGRNNKKEVENAITRIAQLGRASGMHLLVATQRPSVDVITGLIKANIPSRIALTVASQIDSRTIIDKMGAEDLVGYGDMLYSPIGSDPERIQGVLVETEEVESIINHIKRTIDPSMLEDLYDDAITQGESTAVSANGVPSEYNEDPKIIEEAIKISREAGKASTSLLQRRLKLGYSRAARVIDILEEMGIVGPPDGSKPRDVY